MPGKLALKLLFATALTVVCFLAETRLAHAYGPISCPNTGGIQAVGECRDWCIDQCRTRTCYGDCVQLNCTCP